MLKRSLRITTSDDWKLVLPNRILDYYFSIITAQLLFLFESNVSFSLNGLARDK